MATAPQPLSFRAEDLGSDAPEWALKTFDQLNAYGAQANEVLAKGITRGDNLAGTEKLGLTFTTSTPASSTPAVSVAHGLKTGTAKHVVLGKLERTDGAAITAAYSMTWRNGSNGQALLLFQGLSDTTKYRINLTFD